MIPATIVCGCLCGLVNGLLVSRLNVVPFIVTLGMMTVYLGAAKLLSGEGTVTPERNLLPRWLMDFHTSRARLEYHLLGIALGIWTAALLAGAVAVLLRGTVFGRHVFALGSNEATARLCGINVPRTKTAVYALAGLFTGIAGVYHFTNLKQADPAETRGMELDIIAAVVIGGGSLSGGRGSVIGTVTGVGIMAVMRQGCGALDIPNPYQDIISGAIIITAVTLDQLRQRRLGT
jgi:ribose/xylose/arabinose/galactoside ABC-type transport system permease subunit